MKDMSWEKLETAIQIWSDTCEKEERKVWVERALDFSVVLVKSSQVDGAFLSKGFPLEESHLGQESSSSDTTAVHSNWLGEKHVLGVNTWIQRCRSSRLTVNYASHRRFS